MSNRFIERVTAAFVEVGQIIIENINITQWGGVNVAPAGPKDDAQPNAINVPEVGSRLQGYNLPGPGLLGSWDRVRVGLTSITSTFLGFVDVVPYGKHNAGGVVLADGEGAPLQLSSIGHLLVDAFTTPQVVGIQDNAWAAAVTGINGVSASIDCQFTPFVTAFGSVSGATVITLQISQDNITFTDAVTNTIAAAGDFEISRTVGARYVRLKSSLSVTASATIAAKD